MELSIKEEVTNEAPCIVVDWLSFEQFKEAIKGYSKLDWDSHDKPVAIKCRKCGTEYVIKKESDYVDTVCPCGVTILKIT